MDMFACTPVKFSYLETLARPFLIPAKQNQFIRENIFNETPVHRTAAALNTYSALIGSYQQFDLSQIRILERGQPFVHFDAADNCRLYVTTMKAMKARGYPLLSK